MIDSFQILAAWEGSKLHWLDMVILFGYFGILVAMGLYASRKIKSSAEFMVAGGKIPGWAAGLSVMCAYTSSLSYIATPAAAYDSNWHPALFALCMTPVAIFVSIFIIPYYRKIKLISVYGFLEKRLGGWGRVYAAIAFMLYMVGRIALILYLACILLGQFVNLTSDPIHNLMLLICIIGIVTIFYTLLGGMEAVIWADVMQSVIMVGGVLICAGILTYQITKGPDPAIVGAWDAGKFDLGSWDFTLTKRTVWLMLLYGLTENLRNLMADQNYVQKYATCASNKQAAKSIWVATILYTIMTFLFVYIGTALWSYYGPNMVKDGTIAKLDDIFPYYIANNLFIGLRGLIIAAIMAAAISTIATAFNASATVWLQDFHQRFINKNLTDKQSIVVLRTVTVIWGLLGILFALFAALYAKKALDIWWQISGIFGGGILGLFLLALFKVRLRFWRGIASIGANILVVCWGTFARQGTIEALNAREAWQWLGSILEAIKCPLDPIITGATATLGMVLVAMAFGLFNRNMPLPEELEQQAESQPTEQ
ncbi:MAG: hypothetical protein E4H40_00750 [Candidatus Brocadiia bacterium]|nr:MAG: hypothetical protein E4H40_00750 [Candidatus Brocadiia bacterium]